MNWTSLCSDRTISCFCSPTSTPRTHTRLLRRTSGTGSPRPCSCLSSPEFVDAMKHNAPDKYPWEHPEDHRVTEWEKIRWKVSGCRVTMFFHSPPSVQGQRRVEMVKDISNPARYHDRAGQKRPGISTPCRTIEAPSIAQMVLRSTGGALAKTPPRTRLHA